MGNKNKKPDTQSQGDKGKNGTIKLKEVVKSEDKNIYNIELPKVDVIAAKEEFTSIENEGGIKDGPKTEAEEVELDDNGKVLKNVIDNYLKAVVSVPEAKSLPVKESMLKTIVSVFKRPDLTQASADVVNNAFKNEPHCAELPLLRSLNPSLHGVVSFIHAKLEGTNITIEPPIGNAEKIK